MELDGSVRWRTDLVQRFGEDERSWDHGTSPVLTDKVNGAPEHNTACEQALAHGVDSLSGVGGGIAGARIGQAIGVAEVSGKGSK